MEKENPFKLFVPPRLGTGQVPAVRAQGFSKCPDEDFKLPFRAPTRGEITDSAPVSQQGKICSEVDDENTETMSELYTKLYKEAEKIKQWKLSVESELSQKERKLQENRKMIETQHKTIQELQFENEKLHLKLEDELSEKKDLLKESTASRHLCNLLKETCTHFTEKTSRYEQEREETRQLYEELHSNVERMTAAFEELRVQAENDRLEMSFKLKEEAEKVAKFGREHQVELGQKEQQISALLMQSDEKNDAIKATKAQLEEAQDKIAELMEEKGEILKESQINQDHLRAELEEAKISLQKAEVTQKNLETELETTVRKLIQISEEKEAQEEENKKSKSLHSAQTEKFEASMARLKNLLQKEQNRSAECEEESKLLSLELTNKSAELEEMKKLKCEKEKQLEELSDTLAQTEGLLQKKEHLEATLENLQEREEEAKNILQIREEEMQELKAQLSRAAGKEEDYLKQLLALQTNLEQEESKNKQLTEGIKKISLEKEQTTEEKNSVAAELEKLQENLQERKKKEENTKQLVETLEEENGQLRNELEALKEEMAKTGMEIGNKLDEREEKVNNLKKQLENKTKSLEELQQENKVLKKKITSESRKINIYEEKVNKLQLELENLNNQHQETEESFQKEMEIKKENENKLHEEVAKLRLLYEEAAMIQREMERKCQQRIQEMVALMEKHKHEYEKMAEEKDTELKVYKIKQQEQLAAGKSLEKELQRLRSEVSALREQPRAESGEKENLVKGLSQNKVLEREKEHKGERSSNPSAEQSTRKKQKVFLHLDAPSDSSDQSDLLSMVSEEERFKKLYNYPLTSQFHSTAPKKTNTPKTPRTQNVCAEQSTRKKQKVLLHLDAPSDSSDQSDLLSLVSEEEMFKKLCKDHPLASQFRPTAPKKAPPPGSALPLRPPRRAEPGWAAVSKLDRKRKIKEVAKFFA